MNDDLAEIARAAQQARVINARAAMRDEIDSSITTFFVKAVVGSIVGTVVAFFTLMGLVVLCKPILLEVLKDFVQYVARQRG